MPVPSQGHYGFHSFRLLTDFVCLYTYEFWLSLCKIVRSSVILLLPLFKNKLLRRMYYSRSNAHPDWSALINHERSLERDPLRSSVRFSCAIY